MDSILLFCKKSSNATVGRWLPFSRSMPGEDLRQFSSRALLPIAFSSLHDREMTTDPCPHCFMFAALHVCLGVSAVPVICAWRAGCVHVVVG